MLGSQLCQGYSSLPQTVPRETIAVDSRTFVHYLNFVVLMLEATATDSNGLK